MSARCLPGHELPEHSRRATGAPKRTSRKQKLSSRKKLLLRNTMKNTKIAMFPELPKIFPEAKTIFPELPKIFPEAKTAIFPEAKTIFPETKIEGSIGGISATRFWPIGFLPTPEFRHGHWKGHLEDTRKALKLGTCDPSPQHRHLTTPKKLPKLRKTPTYYFFNSNFSVKHG